MRGFLLGSFVAGCLAWTPGEAQTLRLRQQETNSNQIAVAVGDQVDIEIWADLRGAETAGIALYLTIPDEGFQVIDRGFLGQDGTQPFEIGELFAGAMETANLLLPETTSTAQQLAGQQLEYSLVLGDGSQRGRTGAGVVARFSLYCIRPIEKGDISIVDNAVRETLLVMSDGISERRFLSIQGMEITVSGIQLRDIPDVTLLPEQSDELTIGSLNDYVIHTLAAIDSLRWTFSPSDLDSLLIEIDETTKRVRITPAEGWSGRQQIVWTVTEPESRIQGAPPLTASEVSTIIVNHPPRFVGDVGPDGVKRDTVRLVEDRFPFVPGKGALDPNRGFRWKDLDGMVEDVDVLDPQSELAFAVLLPGGLGEHNTVIGKIDPGTHELLVWAKADFSGRDSLKVMVRDARGAEDMLWVIVEVEGENDPPRFVLDDTALTLPPGTSRTYWLDEIIEDIDTPLENLVFSWEDDPESFLTIDTTRTEGRTEVTLAAGPDFTDSGQVTWEVTDPEEPEGLSQRLEIAVSAVPETAPELPPMEGNEEGFWIRSLPIHLQVGVAQILDVFDLDDYVDASGKELQWSVTVVSGNSSTPSIDDDNVVSIWGRLAGVDSLLFTARDALGHTEEATMIVRVVGEEEELRLQSIPDVQFLVGQTFTSRNLNDYLVDRVALPEIETQWSVLPLGSLGPIRVEINQDTTLAVAARDTGSAEVILEVRNLNTGVVARDTITIFALDPTLEPMQLKPFPELVLAAGQEDSSIVLDDFLPEDVKGQRLQVRWRVSGQQITQPFIDSQAPHVLYLKGVGDRIGTERLRFDADIEGGFSAFGQLTVTVIEPLAETGFALHVVPNPTNPSFVDLYVVARRPLAAMPSVIRTFDAMDSTVAVRQIEDDWEKRGILIWTGSIRLPEGAEGTVLFRAQAFTALGTGVDDHASVEFVGSVSGKPVVVSKQREENHPSGTVMFSDSLIFQPAIEWEADEIKRGDPARSR